MTEDKNSKDEGASCGCGDGSCCSGSNKWIWIVLAVAVAGVLIAKSSGKKETTAKTEEQAMTTSAAVETVGVKGANVEPAVSTKALPRLLDLGATKCIPCKMMAPILEDLKKTYAGKMDVQFIDVWENEDAGKKYGINMIPTQIFYDAAGKELFRHEGFFGKEDILAKWKELGIDLGAKDVPAFSRWEPAQKDTRAKESVCYLCDGDIASNSLVVVKTDKGDVRLCGLHHYFVMYSCLTEDKAGFEKKVSVTDWATGSLVPISDAVYVYGMDTKTGRPTLKAFVSKETAEKERQSGGGTVIELSVLQSKELANKCGFCDRAVYPEDVAEVIVGDVKTWGCCSHCALGVAARTGKDIEIREKDRLTGEKVVVKTLDGKVASLEPATAVAWFGQRTKPDGKHVSAGCFHQGFFTMPENLKKWVEANPLETGEMITIQKALEDKMKLSPQQISKACKIGECSPK